MNSNQDRSGVRLSQRFLGSGPPEDDAVFAALCRHLSPPPCEVEYDGESHALERVAPGQGGRQRYLTACGLDLPERPAPTSEPRCPACTSKLDELGYSDWRQ